MRDAIRCALSLVLAFIMATSPLAPAGVALAQERVDALEGEVEPRPDSGDDAAEPAAGGEEAGDLGDAPDGAGKSDSADGADGPDSADAGGGEAADDPASGGAAAADASLGSRKGTPGTRDGSGAASVEAADAPDDAPEAGEAGDDVRADAAGDTITLSDAVLINGSNRSTYDGKTVTGTIPGYKYVDLPSDLYNFEGAIVVDGVELSLAIEGLSVDHSGQYSPRSCISLVNGATLHLTVRGANELRGGYGGAGISVPQGCALEVTAASDGALNAIGGDGYGGGAGIGDVSDGSNPNSPNHTPRSMGAVAINGGTVNATGGSLYVQGRKVCGAAGIGSSNGSNRTGSITINGGTVNATGGMGAAGIGGGNDGSVASIAIASGTVSATRGTPRWYDGEEGAGAAIGCGFAYSEDLTGPDISVTGGTVTADGNIGYGTSAGSERYAGGSVTIDGAVLDCEGEVRAGSVTIIDWKVRIHFDANGGTGTMQDVLAQHGTSYELPDCGFGAPSGKYFKGWQVESGGSTSQADPGSGIDVDVNAVVKPIWGDLCTVTFDANGHGVAPAAQSVRPGEKFAYPEVPTAEGWEFWGWYTEPGCETPYDFDTPATGDVTLYARWVEVGDVEPVRYTYYDTDAAGITAKHTDGMCASYVTLDGRMDEWGTEGRTSWCVAGGSVSIDTRVTVRGDVRLILLDGAGLSVIGGIQVGEGDSLSIYSQGASGGAMGALTITDIGNECAGIGGSCGGRGGTVTVNGGRVTAAGGMWGAGIGGGGEYSDGAVTVNGGSVTATGGYLAAGIGGGSHGSCTVVINGGSVTATGGSSAAGIGGGMYGSGGAVTVNGGSVTAAGGSYGAGIGGGNSGGGATVTVSGGSVTATGGRGGAGIGGGYDVISGGYVAGGTTTLGYGETSAAGTSVYASSYGGTVRLERAFADEASGTVFPATEEADNGQIGGKTLVPALTVSVGTAAHGSVALAGGDESGSAFGVGSTVGLVVEPDEGWRVGSVRRNGEEVAPDGDGGYSFAMPAEDVTVTALFIPDGTDFERTGAGGGYAIRNADGWDVFCDLLADNPKGAFDGVTVHLDKDISVTRMAGGSQHDFTGTFDGQGHTLTVAYGSAESPITEKYAAPFRYVQDGCVIEHLRVAGTIRTSAQNAAGIVGLQYGIVAIRDCRSSVTIRSGVAGDGTHGGLVAVKGNSDTAELTIEGCVFDGAIASTGATATTKCGGFVGWRKDSGSLTIKDCLYAPAEDANAVTDGATFSRNGGTIANCYYTQPLGEAQGKQLRSVAAGEGVTLAPAGKATEYATSGITAYAGNSGLTYDGTLWAGEGDTVSLALGHSNAPEGSEFDGFAVSSGTLTGDANPYTLSMPDGDVTVSATWRVAGDEYVIATTAGWDAFCAMLAGGEGFSGKTVYLDADIAVTSMAGDDDHRFQGAFDGQGHTLTVSYGTAKSPVNEKYAAPFRYVDGCAIEHLRVAGTIRTSAQNAAGIVGEQWGTVAIRDCRSSVTIRSGVAGDGTHGGLVAIKGNSDTAELTIEGCVFDGAIVSTGATATTKCGGFVGWRKDSGSLTIKDCLYAPAADAAAVTDGATFSRNGGTIENCYYTQALGTAQGKQARSITAGEHTTVAIAGTASKAYETSGLDFYGAGVRCGDSLYASSGDSVGLTLGHGDYAGHEFTGYEASAGTLAASGDGYVLAMPDADVTITATWAVSEFTVTWKNGDGSTLKTESVARGVTPEYGGETPTKAATAQLTYAFAGWDPEPAPVTGDVTYTPVFSETTRTYAITWVDGDGETLKVEMVAYGATPAYEGPTPTKEATDEFTYAFNGGWSPEVVPVDGTATYEAQFDATTRKYAVTFVDEDGATVLKAAAEYDYGTQAADVAQPETPTKRADEEYTYEFAGWDPELADVTANATYRATYTATPVVRNEITAQPQSTTARVGDRFTLTIEAAGSVTSYSWQASKDGEKWSDVKWSGHDGDTLSYTMREALDGRMFRCVVGFADNSSETSDVVTVTLPPASRITSHPQDATVAEGQRFSLSVAADGATGYSWQASRGGTSWSDVTWSGHDSATLSYTMRESLAGRMFRCVVSFGDGTTETSEAATVTLAQPASGCITSQPESATVAEGQRFELSVTAEGATGYSWQASRNGSSWSDVAWSGHDTATLGYKMIASLDNRQFRCVVTFSDGATETSEAATVTLAQPASGRITGQPQGATVAEGQRFELSVTAGGATGYSWQASRNGSSWSDVTWSGHDAATLGYKMVASLDGRMFRCVVTFSDGATETSEAATITLAKEE